ncbi:MAG: porin family protein [Devosia sp.]|uniref:outer membrane protein n=1 Tax=Devosia sp. TaxID=1871048 RepID=UPI0024CB896A|nr:outer membrane protein [Devosia sp.]UYN98253.1 MAG: porin family protein [Devosia sp.]
MKRLVVSILACASLCSTASAADLWTDSSPIMSGMPASGWTGFYLGVNGGYSWGTTSNNPALPGGVVDNAASGWLGGLQAGYNLDLGGFVLGTEIDGQVTNFGYAEALAPTGNFEAKMDMFGTARLRVGVPVGQVMPYATGGVAVGRGSASVVDGVTTTTSATHLGWTAGLGLEAQATTNLSIKAEYLYVDLGSQPYNGLPVGNRDIGHKFSVIRAGVNYKF